MSLDVFGRALSASNGPPGIGFNLTDNGDFDVQKKRITNVAPPQEYHDCTPYGTLIGFYSKYIQNDIAQLDKSLATIKRGNDDITASLSKLEETVNRIQSTFKTYQDYIDNLHKIIFGFKDDISYIRKEIRLISYDHQHLEK